MRQVNVIGIMGAMPEEIDGIIHLLTDVTQDVYGMRTYYSGFANGQKYVVVFSRWGKVAAATTVTTLIHEFGVNKVLFIGVAGAIHSSLKVGDVVIGKRFVQHDLDARPLLNKYEIPLLNQSYLLANEDGLEEAKKAVSNVLDVSNIHHLISEDNLTRFHISNPQLYVGDIASGDQFISNDEVRENIAQELPGVLCVEMEGASVAQVCFEYKVPLTVIRTISDEANENSPIEFPEFIKYISSTYSVEIVKQLFNL